MTVRAVAGHRESYNPPPEYLWTDEERRKWEALDPEERARQLPPKKCVRATGRFSRDATP